MVGWQTNGEGRNGMAGSHFGVASAAAAAVVDT